MGRGAAAKAVLCGKVVNINGSSHSWMIMSHTGLQSKNYSSCLVIMNAF